MTPMTPMIRKLALTAHVITSVGWFGAVFVFLILAVAGLTSSEDEPLLRAAYLATKLITWAGIVPLAFASLLTGVVQSLGTKWGLFRHYWVVLKLALTIFATVVLLIHTQPINELAAYDVPSASARALSLRRQLVVDASAALVLLFTTTVLGVYKPRGLTKYGQRVDRKRC